jgi:hypothetical protein
VSQNISDVAISSNGVRIRLTGERWSHIVEEHRELTDLRLEVLKAISSPVRIVEGGDGALLAVREIDLGKYLVVVYRELANDGFVITAFLTRRIRILARRKQLWP